MLRGLRCQEPKCVACSSAGMRRSAAHQGMRFKKSPEISVCTPASLTSPLRMRYDASLRSAGASPSSFSVTQSDVSEALIKESHDVLSADVRFPRFFWPAGVAYLWGRIRG